MDVKKLFSATNILTKVLNTSRRFPVIIATTIVCFILFILLQKINTGTTYIIDANKYKIIKALLEATSAIALIFSVDIFSEQQELSKNIRIGLYLLCFCILGLHYYSSSVDVTYFEAFITYKYVLFIICFHLLISIAAFYKEKDIYAFWQYNQFLFLRFLTSFFYSAILFLGIASCIWSVEKLFGFHFSNIVYTSVAGFIFFVIQTFFFLYNIPSPITEFRKRDDYIKSLRVFVQYVMLPILLIYATILYVYIIKIIYTQMLPTGWVCVPILVFAIIGILTFLFIYPIRNEKSYPLIHFFAHRFFYILLPLLAMYLLGIYYRVKPYGFTEERYLILLLGVWLLVISLYIISSKKDNIIILPISLFIMLGLSIIGPWSMFNISSKSQQNRLGRVLKKNNLLGDYKLINNKVKKQISIEDANNIASIVKYLYNNNKISLIRPWFKDHEQVILDSLVKNNKGYAYILGFMGFQTPNNIIDETHSVFFRANNSLHNESLNISGYNKLIYFSAYAHSVKNSNDTSLDALLFSDSLLITYKKHILFSNSIHKNVSLIYSNFINSYKYNSEANTLFDTYFDATPISYEKEESIDKLTWQFEEGEKKYKLIIDILDINYSKNKYTITQLGGILLYN